MIKMRFSKKFILVILTGLIIVGGLIIFYEKIWQIVPEKEAKTQEENLEKKVSLIIDDEEGNPKIFQSDFKEQMTAFDLLKAKAEEADLTLKTKSYETGTLVEAIGNKENGQDGKYWLYYVNGEMPQVAADKLELKVGDKVEFKFEKSPF